MVTVFRMRFAVAALLLLAVMEATNLAGAQNLNDLDSQRAARHAEAEWRRVLPAEIACIGQRLRRKGSSIEALVRRGVKPTAAWLIKLRSSCRDFVQGVQTDAAPWLARDTTGSPKSTIPANNSTEPTNADAKSLAHSAIESGTGEPTQRVWRYLIVSIAERFQRDPTV
jgi:hypothetical protein